MDLTLATNVATWHFRAVWCEQTMTEKERETINLMHFVQCADDGESANQSIGTFYQKHWMAIKVDNI